MRNCIRFLAVMPILALGLMGTTVAAGAEPLKLPQRSSPVPATTRGVPHVQIGVTPDPVISKEMLRSVSRIPGVDIRDTVISLPGALGFWINRRIKIGRPEVIVAGREFAHMHPDGSLHASLSPKLARRAVAAGWAAHHPWANRRPGWEGFVMIYTPKTQSELKVVMQLIWESYNFVTSKPAGSTDS